MSKTVPAEIHSLFVISGKGRNVSLPKYDSRPTSKPENRARWVLTEPRTMERLCKLSSKRIKLSSPSGRPSEKECRAAAQRSLASAGLDGWQAGPVLVKGRTIKPDGTWVPTSGPGGGTAADGSFAYAFLLQIRDAATKKHRDYTIPLPLKDSYLEVRPVVVVQSAGTGG